MYSYLNCNPTSNWKVTTRRLYPWILPRLKWGGEDQRPHQLPPLRLILFAAIYPSTDRSRPRSEKQKLSVATTKVRYRDQAVATPKVTPSRKRTGQKRERARPLELKLLLRPSYWPQGNLSVPRFVAKGLAEKAVIVRDWREGSRC
jgi:hypothetical protein